MDWEDLSPATRLLPPGKDLYICLGLNFYSKPAAEVVTSAIKSLKPAWKRIKFMELGDEPQWSAKEIEGMVKVVQDACKVAKLPVPPLGCTFTEKQIMKGQSWKAKGLDWIGIEGYVPYVKNENAAQVYNRVQKCLKDQLVRVGTKQVVIVGQAYDRNGTWLDRSTLSSACRAAFDVAKTRKALAVNWFAYARPGGTMGDAPLMATHKSLYAQRNA
jgi:hypothetical protein